MKQNSMTQNVYEQQFLNKLDLSSLKDRNSHLCFVQYLAFHFGQSELKRGNVAERINTQTAGYP